MTEHLPELFGLAGKLFRRRRALFGTGRILLGDLIDLSQPLVDLSYNFV